MSGILPEGYKPLLDLKRTEQAIKLVKDTFERNLSSELRLSRVTSPIFVPRGSGINDDLAHGGRAPDYDDWTGKPWTSAKSGAYR